MILRKLYTKKAMCLQIFIIMKLNMSMRLIIPDH
ncbi:Uncharacterised protein [Klebsiella pneumoniae]|nr:Uncharacterised protein [Klebsiella pneumoniae]